MAAHGITQVEKDRFKTAEAFFCGKPQAPQIKCGYKIILPLRNKFIIGIDVPYGSAQAEWMMRMTMVMI